MFRLIIVAVDGSKHSDKAVECAREIATRFGSALYLLHAFPQTSDLLGYDEYEKLMARREAAGQSILNKAKLLLAEAQLDLHEELLEGPPAEAIILVAETRGADLIVMGTRGLSALQGAFVGSVSHKVMQHAPCPVLVVR